MKKLKLLLKSISIIALGSFILALGINIFLNPSKISSGGISSIATILLYTLGIRLSVTSLLINVILFLLGFKYLGREAIIKTIIGIVLLSLFLELTSYFPIYNEEIILSTIVGGALVGIGVGLVVRQSASTGGSDFLAMIIHRFLPHIPLARIILVIDLVVIIASGIVFKSITITIYSIIAMYISSLVTDSVITFGNKAKALQIFSNKNEEIAKYVVSEFKRGITGIYSRGMYSGDEKLMLLCIVSPKELPKLVSKIKNYDPHAFIIISDVKEVLGEGFQK